MESSFAPLRIFTKCFAKYFSKDLERNMRKYLHALKYFPGLIEGDMSRTKAFVTLSALKSLDYMKGERINQVKHFLRR